MMRQIHTPCRYLLSALKCSQRRANVVCRPYLKLAFDINFEGWEEMSGPWGKMETLQGVRKGIKTEKNDDSIFSRGFLRASCSKKT